MKSWSAFMIKRGLVMLVTSVLSLHGPIIAVMVSSLLYIRTILGSSAIKSCCLTISVTVLLRDFTLNLLHPSPKLETRANVRQEIGIVNTHLLFSEIRTVFVGNILFDVKTEEIYQLFWSKGGVLVDRGGVLVLVSNTY